MRLRLLLLALLPLLSGGAGYGAGRLLASRLATQAEAAKAAAEAGPGPVVALGQIVAEAYHPATIRDFVTEAQVTLKPGAAGTALVGPMGEARLKDRAYQVLFDAVETPLLQGGDVPAQAMADLLAHGLGQSFPEVASVQILSSVSSERTRD